MSDGSMKAVVTAVFANSTVTVAKFVGFAFSGSSALLAEAVHSLADTANQALLWLGLKRSQRAADQHHQFGYGPERYFWNLVSAVTIFFVGCVYTVMHAMEQLRHGSEPELSITAFAIIGIAFVVEGYSFFVATTEFNAQRKEAGAGFFQYFSETRDPTTLAVLIEDSVAMLGLLLALLGMGMSAITGSAVFDGIAAILIGLLMGFLAFFLAKVNRKFLINASDPGADEAAREIWGGDERIQQIHRLNSIVLSPEETIVMTEIEMREEELFANMSKDEVAHAIRFMRRLSDIKQSLENEVQAAAPRVKHIFVEFDVPAQKAPE